MPAFIAGFAGFFTGTIVGGIAGTVGYLAAAAVFNAALGAIARKFTSSKESAPGRSQPREVTVRATDGYDVFVYGRALVGGVTVYHNGIPDSTGANNRMHHAVKWAGHPCTSIALFRLDDRTLHPTSANISWNPQSYTGTGLVQGGEFRGSSANSGPTYMRWYLGDQTSSDQRLTAQANEWTTAHIGQAQTYGVLEVWQVDGDDQTSKVFQKGFPNNIAAHILGKKVYDHRRYALNGDPTFLNPSSYWFSGENSGSIDVTSWIAVEGVGGTNDRSLSVTDNENSTNPWAFSEPVPVSVSSTYSLTVRARRVSGDRPAYIGVSFWDGNGVNINANSSDATGWIIGTFHYILANTHVPSQWTEFAVTFGSGEVRTIPSCTSFIRIGALGPSSGSTETELQIQDYAVWLGTGSRHLVNVASTWQYSESPPFCVADYLTDERLGFGKRLRIPINPSRYARNGDPTWRRQGTLTNGVWWRTSPESGGSTAINSFAVAGSPVGRRALLITGSDGTVEAGHQFWSDAVQIDPTGQYFVTVQARQDGPKSALLGLAFLDGNGVNINAANSSDATGWTLGTFHYFHVNLPFSTTWSNYLIAIGSGSSASIPSCASFVAIGAIAVQSFGTNGETKQYFQDYRLMVGTQDRHFIEPHEQIFWPSVSSAASYTDAIVATPSGDQVRFACNGAGHTGKGHRQNVRDLLSSFNGRAVYVQSGFHITAGWEEPTKTLNKSDFRAGGMKIRAKAELLDRYNHVRGTFYDPENEFKNVPMATVTAPEYVARDSSMELFHDTHLPFTNDWFMAQRVAFGILEQGDNQQLVEFQLKHSALDLMPGRVVGITHDVVSWNNHTLRMVDMKTDLKKGVTLFAREDYEASYVDVGTSEYFSRTFNGVTSAAPIVPQVSSAVVTYLGRDGIQLDWNNPAARSFEWIDIYRRVGTTNAFSGSTLIKSVRADQYMDSVSSLSGEYRYWFRSRDFAGNVSSIFPGLTTSIGVVPVVPQVSSVSVTSRQGGVQLNWINPDPRFYEKTDIYRRRLTNAFSGSTLIKSTRNDEYFDPPLTIGPHHYWFQTRDFAGNVSSVYPGLTTSFSAIITEANLPGGSYVSDPTFMKTTSFYAFDFENPVAYTDDFPSFHWMATHPGVDQELVAGEGVGLGTQGVVRLHEHNADAKRLLRNAAKPGFSNFVKGQWVLVAVRLRKRDSTTLTAGSEVVISAGQVQDDSDGASLDLVNQFIHTDINGWVVDAWQDFLFTVQLNTQPSDTFPWIAIDISHTFLGGTMRVDVDYFNMVPIADPT